MLWDITSCNVDVWYAPHLPDFPHMVMVDLRSDISDTFPISAQRWIRTHEFLPGLCALPLRHALTHTHPRQQIATPCHLVTLFTIMTQLHVAKLQNLAARTFSSSVADALEFLKKGAPCVQRGRRNGAFYFLCLKGQIFRPIYSFPV